MLCSVAVFGCKESSTPPAVAPSADFEYVRDNQTAPTEVSFTNSSTDAESYIWDFGDGKSSSEENPKHTFEYGGKFKVSLTATGAGGTDSVSKTVSLNHPYTGAVIKGFELHQLPLKDANGNPWDVGSHPDVFYTFTNKAGTIVLDYSADGSRADDLDPAIVGNPNLPYWLANLALDLDEVFLVQCWDYDNWPDEHDLMGEIVLSGMGAASEGYPQRYNIINKNLEIQFTLEWTK